MLLAIREKITGIIAWAVVVLISIPFMLWGVNQYFKVGQERFAVKVNDTEVSFQDYDRMMTQNRQQLIQSFGGRMPAYFDAEKFLREQTLEQLINRELLKQFTDDNRFRIAPAQLADAIRTDSRFQLDGQFKPEFYQAELRAVGMSKRAYEEDRMQQLEARQLQAGLRSTAVVDKLELADFARLQRQVRDFDYALLALEDQAKKIKISDDEIKAFYDKQENQSRFKTQERIKIDYIELSLQKLADAVNVDEARLKQEYEDGLTQGRFQTDETRKASHILIKLPADASEDMIVAKRTEAEELRQRILKGESFEELAKKHSEDAGSAAQGGSLGEVARGSMVKPFEEALFALEPGKLSEPVKTRFGFHIIRVDSIKPAVVKPLADVRDELLKDIRNKQADPEYYEILNSLETLAFESADLGPAGESSGIQVQTSDWFTADQGQGVAQHPEVRQAAFDEKVLMEGRNSETIEVGPEHVVFIHVHEHQPSRAMTLAEAKEQIVKELTDQKARAALDELADKLYKDAVVAGSLQKVATQYGGTYKSLKDVKRDGSEAPREVVQAVFRMAPPSEQTVLERVTMPNGDIAFAQLKRVVDGDLQWLTDQEKQQLSRQLVEQRGQYDLQASMQALREQSEIVISPDLEK